MRLTASQLIYAALLLSLLLHALLLALPRLQGASSEAATRHKFQVVELRHQAAPPPLPSVPPRQTPPIPLRKSLPTSKTASRPRATAQPQPANASPPQTAASSKLQMPAQNDAPAANAPTVNFAESARAAATAASRAVQSDAWQQNGVLRPKEEHRNLKKPEEELTTALGRDFEKRFGAEVVLSVEEHQEGTERMTIVRTNKGMRCGYTRLVNPQYMGNFPMITRWGDCAKTQ